MDESWHAWVKECLKNNANPKELALILRQAKLEIADIQELMGTSFPEIVLGSSTTPNEASFFDQQSAINRLLNANPGRSLKIDPDTTPGILIIQDYIPADTCARLVQYTKERALREMNIHHTEDINAQRIYTRTAARVAHEMRADETIPEVLDIFRDICCNIMAPFYNVEYEWHECPQLLCYPPGGSYNAHSDSEEWCKETNRWKKMVSRDHSILLYLNDEYEGGEIEFPKQRYTVKPKPGMLLTFPSDNRYMHGALPTRSGLRHVAVSWASVTGVPENLAPEEWRKVVYLKSI